MKTTRQAGAPVGHGGASMFARACARILLLVALAVGPALELAAQIITPPGVPGGSTNPPAVAVITVRAVDPYASEPCVATVVDNGMFVISRSYYTNLDMTVFFKLGGTASNGVDYVLNTTTADSVVIPKGKWSVEVPVRALADNLPEGVETVVMRLEPMACIAIYPPPPWCYMIGQPAEAVVYIRDCPPVPPPVYVKILKPAEGQLFQAPATVPIVARTADPGGYFWKAEFFANARSIHTSTVAYFVAPTNGSPFDWSYEWKNVPAGRYALTVQGTTGNGIVRTSAPVNIVVGPITTQPPPVSVVATEPVAVEGTNCWGWWTFTNRYPAGAMLCSTTVAGWNCPIWWYTNCGPKNATFTIRRGGPTNEDLRVFYVLKGTATNGVDYEMLPDSVVIPAGARKANVLIVPKEDAVIEPPETVVLQLVLPPYANPLPAPYAVAWPGRAGAIIVDSARPRLRPAFLSDRCFYLGVTAMEGAWFRMERSTNMIHWEPVCTNQVVQGNLSFVDPDAETSDQGFYRAVPVDTPAE